MSNARRVAREERERMAAEAAAALAARAERAARRTSRWSAVTRRLPSVRSSGRPGSRQTGALAQRRRGEVRATVAILVALNVLVWVVDSDWAARALVLVVSLLAAPVLHTVLFKR